MDETDDDLLRLQEMLYRTLARANPHLASIVSPERWLSAGQVVCYLRGTKHVAFATVNERGEPHGSARRRLRPRKLHRVHRRSRGPASAPPREPGLQRGAHGWHVVGIAVNGRAKILEEGDVGNGEIEPIWSEIYGSSPFMWGKGVVVRVVEPTSTWAYACHPDNFPA